MWVLDLHSADLFFGGLPPNPNYPVPRYKIIEIPRDYSWYETNRKAIHSFIEEVKIHREVDADPSLIKIPISEDYEWST